MSSSNTAQNSESKTRGRPFQKGDPRINRRGRPRTFDQLRKLAIDILREPAKQADGTPLVVNGHVATNIEALLRIAMKDKRMTQWLVEIAYGKVPDRVELSGREGAPLPVRVYDYYAAVAEIASGSEPDSNAQSEDQGGLHGPAMGQDDDGR